MELHGECIEFDAGTVFWQRPEDQPGISERFSALFFSAVFATLNAVRIFTKIERQEIVKRGLARTCRRSSPTKKIITRTLLHFMFLLTESTVRLSPADLYATTTVCTREVIRHVPQLLLCSCDV